MGLKTFLVSVETVSMVANFILLAFQVRVLVKVNQEGTCFMQFVRPFDPS